MSFSLVLVIVEHDLLVFAILLKLVYGGVRWRLALGLIMNVSMELVRLLGHRIVPMDRDWGCFFRCGGYMSISYLAAESTTYRYAHKHRGVDYCFYREGPPVGV
jgi:hypothetical protein